MWVLGNFYYGLDQHSAYSLHWDGNEWETIPTRHVLDYELPLGIDVVGPADVWGLLQGVGLIERFHDGRWGKAANLAARGGLSDIAATSSSDVWVAGSHFQHGEQAQETFIKHWDGSSWRVVSSPDPDPGRNGYLLALDARTPADAWAVGVYKGEAADSDQFPLIERWDGNRWKIVPSPTVNSAELSSVSAVSSNDAWAVGPVFTLGPGLIEHWDGEAWSLITPPTPPNTRDAELVRVEAISAEDVWVLGTYVPESSDYPYTEFLHWDGRTWSVQTTFPKGRYPLDMTAVSPTEIWAVGYRVLTHKTAPLAMRICPINVLDSGFAPTSAEVPLGETASFSFDPDNVVGHSVTDASGLGLFDSGIRNRASSFAHAFTAAGTYEFIDEATSQSGVIGVRPRATPPIGDATTPFTIRWAVVPTGSTLVYDVEVRRPGTSAYVP